MHQDHEEHNALRRKCEKTVYIQEQTHYEKQNHQYLSRAYSKNSSSNLLKKSSLFLHDLNFS